MLSPVTAEIEEPDSVLCISPFQILVTMPFLNKAVQRKGVSRGSSQSILGHTQERQAFQDTKTSLFKINIEQISALILWNLHRQGEQTHPRNLLFCAEITEGDETLQLHSRCIDHFKHILALKEQNENRAGICHLHQYT